jgi:hypothetical protein
MSFSEGKLLSSLSMQIQEGIQKVRDARTNIEKVYDPIVKVEVQIVWHFI